jgi:Carbohydrate family 9 binding domain-like/Domain of unknown function (DUF5916)
MKKRLGTAVSRSLLLSRAPAQAVAVGCAALALSTGVGAAEAALKSFEIKQITRQEAPKVDGRLDDAAWQKAAVIEDFRQFQQIENADATEKMVVYVMHDEDMLYVAAKLHDSAPDRITANILRQGERMNNEDKFAVILDTFNDKRNGYRFEVNPNGIRDDALYLDTTQLQWEWEGIYYAKSARDGEGWTAEMAIPFKTLSFDPTGTTWGINFQRLIARKNERDGWVFRNRNQNPSIAGEVTGIKGLEQGLGLDVVPSVSFREEKDHVAATSEFKVEPSLDVYYKVTPGLNASLTFNTDFSATEVDNRQVNLSRFSLFFPEKRGFFLRESDIFEFGRLKGGDNTGNISSTFARSTLENGRPFFSRRIGLSGTGDPVDLVAGAKVSGRIGGFNVGALAIRQDEQLAVDARNLFVARAVANVLAESSLGLIATSGDPRSNLDNTVVGADFKYINSRFAGGRLLEGEAWAQKSDTEGLEGDDGAWGFRLRSPMNTGWYGALGLKHLEENFNPALGYVNRRGINDHTAELGYTKRRPGRAVQALRSGVDIQQFNEIESGDLESRTITWRALEAFTPLNDQLKLFYIKSTEVLDQPFEISDNIFVPVGRYDWDEVQLQLEGSASRKLSGGVTLSAGDFYTGDRWKAGGDFVWKMSPHFWLTGAYEYNNVTLPEGDFIVRLMSTRFDVMFNATWSWVTLIQYDNVSDSIAAHSRVRWIPEAGREMFIVFNHNLAEEIPNGGFRSQRADATVKFNYTFRF